MRQYCRYCNHCHYGDAVYCDVKEKTMPESRAKAVNNCIHFVFNELDVFYGGDMSKVYKPQKTKETKTEQIGGQLCLQL